MNLKRQIGTVLLPLFMVACGSEEPTPATPSPVVIPESLVGTWIEKPASADTEKIVITAERRITLQMPRQVGHEGSGVPYPTVCHYELSGQIQGFGAPTEERTSMYKESGKPTPEMTLNLLIEDVRILPSPRNSPNCEAFAQRQKEQIRQLQGIRYTEDFIEANSYTLVKAWSGISFMKQP
jgi:hypothetical protein